MLFMTEPVKLSSIECTYWGQRKLSRQLAEHMYESFEVRPVEDDFEEGTYGYSPFYEAEYNWEESAYRWFDEMNYELSPDVMVSYVCDRSGKSTGDMILSELNKHIPIINKLVKI